MILNPNEALVKLWLAWNIKLFLIISLSLQIILNLTAPNRKRSKVAKKWYFRWPFWLVYLFADWVAIHTIGLIFGFLIPSSSEDPPSDILSFWAPFLLLHLGGPDNITSYALEDNNFWKRHLFQLVLQVSFTILIILFFSSKKKLLLPAILVLFAAIIKYAERNIAFYHASFDHFGDGWSGDNTLPIPKQFEDVITKPPNNESDPSTLRTAAKLFGILKRLLVGPLIDKKEAETIKETFDGVSKQHGDALQVLEIELSLLYEVLHTKIPAIASKCGLYFRIASIVCIFFALLSFSLAKKDYTLAEFDVFITYALLVGAIVLDFTSIWFLIKRSDWFAICRIQDVPNVVHKRRWSNMVSQSNIITYHVKENPSWLKPFEKFPYICNFLRAVKDFQCESSKNFGEVNQLWSFIFEEVNQFQHEDGFQIQQVWLIERGRNLLHGEVGAYFDGLDYTQSLLILHIASELCFQVDDQSNERASDGRAICKLLSSYMFHLAVTESAMVSTVFINWKLECQDFLTKIHKLNITSANERDVCWTILEHEFPAVGLAKELMMRGMDKQWEVMSQIWVQFMCYAAINCRADVHAQQLSQGGELLTLVWLLMNHLGLTAKPYAGLDMLPREESEENSRASPPILVENLHSTFYIPHHYHINVFP